MIPQRVPTVGDKQGPRVLQQERRLMGEMMWLMEENDAPAEQFARLGLEADAPAPEQ